MLLRLEFAEKKSDLEPALKIFHEAVDGNVLNISAIITDCMVCYRNLRIRIIERFVLHHLSDREHD